MNRQSVIISLILIGGLGIVAFLSYISIQNAPLVEKAPLINPLTNGLYSLNIVSFNPSLYIGDETDIVWEIQSDAPAAISGTEIHYSRNVSVLSPSPAEYISETELQQGIAPATFSTKISFQDEGLIYFKAHARINGTDIWSGEYAITSKPTSWKIVSDNSSGGGGSGGAGSKGGGSGGGSSGGSSGGNNSVYIPKNYSYILEMDDLGFYNGEQQLSSLDFRKGDTLLLTFQVRTENVNPAGFEFISPFFQSPQLRPGQSWTAQKITLNSSFAISALDPDSGSEVAELAIIAN